MPFISRSEGRSLLGHMPAVVVLVILGAAPAHADKCTGAKAKALANEESGLLACQAKVAASGATLRVRAGNRQRQSPTLPGAW
jgi:hypothetical protein